MDMIDGGPIMILFMLWVIGLAGVAAVQELSRLARWAIRGSLTRLGYPKNG